MLTPEQITALRDVAGNIAQPITEYLLQDIVRRVSEAGQLTSAAAYQMWRAQNLGITQNEIKKKLKKLLNTSESEIERLLEQSAEAGYDFDLSNLPTAEVIPFAENSSLQQIVSAAVAQAQQDFTNLTQTLGMVDPYGKAQPLQDVYHKCCDFAFEQVFTGATDYNTAIRRATKNLADMGVRVIDYESGVHTSIEAATRRNVMGGLGLMQEQISQQNHDSFGADGWEISAHGASAPDHEPIQGKQYTDAEYQALNNSLARRIGTLNCGHAAFPIVLSISEPQYTDKQLQRFRDDNVKGIDYQGRHYSNYEATQKQRQVERCIRKQKNRILVDDAVGDTEKLQIDQIRLQRLNQEYSRFSKAAGIPTQRERAQVAGFGSKQAAQASGTYKKNAALRNVEKSATIQVEKEDFARLLVDKDGLPQDFEITKEAISNIKSVPLDGFTTGAQTNMQSACKKLLTDAQNQPLGIECSCVVGMDGKQIGDVHVGKYGHTGIANPDVLYVGWHTHPDGSFLSISDIQSFLRKDNMQAIGALGHDANYSVLQKTINANEYMFSNYIKDRFAELRFGEEKQFTYSDLIRGKVDWKIVDKSETYDQISAETEKILLGAEKYGFKYFVS